MHESDPAATPLDAEEFEGLLPTHLASRAELNQWEALNIASALRWVLARRNPDVLGVKFLRELHRRMFGETWVWAGSFRRSDKSISPFAWHQVPSLMHELVEDTRARRGASGGSDVERDELAARFHHELVRIHPWPNGNGRHARLATDLLLEQWGRPAFSWGGADLEIAAAAREPYVAALRSADGGRLDDLIRFARS